MTRLDSGCLARPGACGEACCAAAMGSAPAIAARAWVKLRAHADPQLLLELEVAPRQAIARTRRLDERERCALLAAVHLWHGRTGVGLERGGRPPEADGSAPGCCTRCAERAGCDGKPRRTEVPTARGAASFKSGSGTPPGPGGGGVPGTAVVPCLVPTPKSWTNRCLVRLPLELDNSPAITADAPLHIEAYYVGERQQFGYEPAFIPNTVTFDPANRPFIRTRDGCLQILQDDGTWHAVNLLQAAIDSWYAKKAALGAAWTNQWNGNTELCPYSAAHTCPAPGSILRSSNQIDERVVFDASGGAYTILRTTQAANVNLNMLLHSQDGGYHWEVYPIPDTQDGVGARLEHTDGPNDVGAPGILIFNSFVEGGYLRGLLGYFEIVKKTAHGLDSPVGKASVPGSGHVTLELAEHPVLPPGVVTTGPAVAGGQPPSQPLFGPLTPGLGVEASTQPSYTATFGGKTHILFIGATNHRSSRTVYVPGTPTYVVTFHHASKTMSAPFYLGSSSRWDRETQSLCNPGKRIGSGDPVPPDPHDFPAICADAQGTLHVIIGAHGRQLQYTRSPAPPTPNAPRKWLYAEPIGKPRCASQHSYPALVCDRKGTLHLVARSSTVTSPGGYYGLVYFRRPGAGPWSDPVTLVDSWHPLYTDWYHELTLDRDDRLFLKYEFMADQLTAAEAAAYRARWPGDGLVKDDPACAAAVCWYSGSVRAHDPAIILSDDGGDSWRLAETADFFEGMGLCRRLPLKPPLLFNPYLPAEDPLSPSAHARTRRAGPGTPAPTSGTRATSAMRRAAK